MEKGEARRFKNVYPVANGSWQAVVKIKGELHYVPGSISPKQVRLIMFLGRLMD